MSDPVTGSRPAARSSGDEPGDDRDYVTTYAYDDAGRLYTRTNDRGAIETFEYDALDRPAKYTDASGHVWCTFYTPDSAAVAFVAARTDTGSLRTLPGIWCASPGQLPG